jgi:hypothetical protein
MTSSVPSGADVDQADRLPFHAVRVDQLRSLCRDAIKIDRPFILERWISGVLGRVWERRAPLPDLPDEDLMFVVGKPLLDACVCIGGAKGKTFLSAVAQIDRGPLGLVAGVLADAIPKARVPPWMARVGEPTTITRAFSAAGAGEEEAVLLQTDRTGVDAHMVAAFISGELGGIAKHLSVLRVIDPLRDESLEDARSRFSEVDPVLAADRVRVAIERTDNDFAAPVGVEFSAHRAVAIARITPRPNALTRRLAC